MTTNLTTEKEFKECEDENIVDFVDNNRKDAATSVLAKEQTDIFNEFLNLTETNLLDEFFTLTETNLFEKDETELEEEIKKDKFLYFKLEREEVVTDETLVELSTKLELEADLRAKKMLQKQLSTEFLHKRKIKKNISILKKQIKESEDMINNLRIAQQEITNFINKNCIEKSITELKNIIQSLYRRLKITGKEKLELELQNKRLINENKSVRLKLKKVNNTLSAWQIKAFKLKRENKELLKNIRPLRIESGNSKFYNNAHRSYNKGQKRHEY